MSWEIIEGDCIEAMAAMPTASVDLVVTDPPYGMAYRSNMRAQWARFAEIQNDEAFDHDWQVSWMRECHRLLKDGSHFYTFCSDHHLGAFREAVAIAGFSVKRTLVWSKGGGGMGDLKGDYAHETEFVVFAHRGQRDLSGKRISNVLHVPKIRPKAMLHPTEKPPGVVRPLIQKSSAPGDTVLDPFAGSGSTGVAAREEQRNFILIEQDPRYVAIIHKRLAQASMFDGLEAA